MPAHWFRALRTGDLIRAAVLLLASLTACADGPPSEQTIVADSAGIRVVSNLAPETPLD